MKEVRAGRDAGGRGVQVGAKAQGDLDLKEPPLSIITRCREVKGPCRPLHGSGTSSVVVL